MYLCESNGIEVVGVPKIIFDTESDSVKYSMDGISYFIYPTHKEHTQASKGILGLAAKTVFGEEL